MSKSTMTVSIIENMLSFSCKYKGDGTTFKLQDKTKSKNKKSHSANKIKKNGIRKYVVYSVKYGFLTVSILAAGATIYSNVTNVIALQKDYEEISSQVENIQDTYKEMDSQNQTLKKNIEETDANIEKTKQTLETTKKNVNEYQDKVEKLESIVEENATLR